MKTPKFVIYLLSTSQTYLIYELEQFSQYFEI
jgi:hypothetical protein